MRDVFLRDLAQFIPFDATESIAAARLSASSGDGERDGGSLLLVDLACGTGASTRALAERWPAARVVGVDLSPYFLAVANAELRALVADGRVELRHANAAEPGWVRDATADAVVLAGATHEMTAEMRRATLAAARRALRRGGVFALLDVDPARISAMPRPIYALFKSTEPDMDAWLACDLEAELRDAGFLALPAAAGDAARAAASLYGSELLSKPRATVERRLSVFAIAI